MPICRLVSPSARLLLVLLSTIVAASRSLVAPSEGQSPHRKGSSLLQTQRWATPPGSSPVELSGEDLTTYVATGRMPAKVHEPPTDPEDIPPTKRQESEYMKHADKVYGDMKKYEEQMKNVMLQAQAAYNKTVDQEKRLSDSFRNSSKLLDGLIQKAAREASEAEVKTMQERLQRIHYKQISALDRSATHWLELAQKEKEARRVAEARGRLLDASADADEKELQKMREAMAKEKAETDAWFKDYWAQLERSEKEALEKDKVKPPEGPLKIELPPVKVEQAPEIPVKVEEHFKAQPKMVSVKPGEVVPNA